MSLLGSIEGVVAATPRPAFAAVTTLDGPGLRLRAVNAAFRDVTGWSAERACAETFPQPCFGVEAVQRIRDAVRLERAATIDLAWPAEAGPRRLRLHLLPAGDAGWLGFLDDAPALAASESPTEIEARYRTAAESGSDWVWETGPDHRFTWLSPRHRTVGPMPREEVVGRTRWDLARDMTDDAFWQEHRAMLDRHEEFRDFAYSLKRGDGEIRHVVISGAPIFAPDGAFRGYRGVGRDVTAETIARHQAGLAESRLIDALENCDDGFALFDSADRLLHANRRAIELAGPISHLFRPGTPYVDIVRGAAATGRYAGSRDEVERHVARRLAQRAHPPNRVEFQVNDGRWLSLTETRTMDGGIVMIYRDVTEMKRVEAVLRRAADEAEAANQAKSEFLANMSHELRTPLNAIIGFAEIIAGELMGPAAGPRYRNYASDIRTSGMHLLDVVNQILDMSKIEAGRYELREEPLDIAESAMAAMRLVERMAREAQVTLNMALPERPPVLIADRRGVRQILLNLLSNAIKFTPAGGRVELSAAVNAQGELEFAVSDTGIGIAEADVPVAFAPFGQVDSPMTRQRMGTGLGLPIVKALAELHGGSVALESRVGVGTIVRVRFPAARVGAAHQGSEMA